MVKIVFLKRFFFPCQELKIFEKRYLLRTDNNIVIHFEENFDV